MLDFQVLDRAVLSPHVSITGDQQGPFVDTMVNLAGVPAQRRVYLSERDVRRAALKLGWTSPLDTSVLVDEIDALRAEVSSLRAELESSADMRVVSLDEVKREFAAAGGKRRGNEAA